jgi:hypothetical protein
LGSADSATGGLRGVYGPPDSAAGQLRGIYGPPQSPAPTPLSSTLAGSANSSTDNVPYVSLPGKAQEGQSLPEGVQASPIPGRPGYGRAMVNDRPAIVDMNGNRIVQFTDSPGQLSGVGPAQTSSSARRSSTLAGSSNSSTNYSPYSPYAPSGAQIGQSLPGGVATTPTPYGAGSGYGQVWINGRMVLFDRSNNRIMQILR